MGGSRCPFSHWVQTRGGGHEGAKQSPAKEEQPNNSNQQPRLQICIDLPRAVSAPVWKSTKCADKTFALFYSAAGNKQSRRRRVLPEGRSSLAKQQMGSNNSARSGGIDFNSRRHCCAAQPAFYDAIKLRRGRWPGCFPCITTKNL